MTQSARFFFTDVLRWLSASSNNCLCFYISISSPWHVPRPSAQAPTPSPRDTHPIVEDILTIHFTCANLFTHLPRYNICKANLWRRACDWILLRIKWNQHIHLNANILEWWCCRWWLRRIFLILCKYYLCLNALSLTRARKDVKLSPLHHLRCGRTSCMGVLATTSTNREAFEP